MRFKANAKFVRCSPYKLRPLADVIRQKGAQYALSWLETVRNRRAQLVRKVVASAVANAKDRENMSPEELLVKTVSIEQGPINKYFKPGAKGSPNVQRKRLCHIMVVLESKEKKV